MVKTNNGKKELYDAVIIGAGIGGLVCGCYLAKAGMRVLIVEQHSKPGGYCTSFKRKGFTFDAAAHSFGGYRKNGLLRKVFDDFGVEKKVAITRFDPSDTIITPDYTISFWSDIEKTIRDFQVAFPAERNNVRNFFSFLVNPEPALLVRMRKWTVKNLLDNYFNNDTIKSVLSFPLLGNGGLPPSLMSAFAGSKILTEFLLDGGYYPEGGMQALPEILAAIFQEAGGELRLLCSGKKVTVKENKINGIILQKGEFIPTGCLVSNCDARQTFLKFLSKGIVSADFTDTLKNMIPSLSMFVLYLGVNEYSNALPKPGTNVWLLPHYDIEKMYLLATRRTAKNMAECMLRVSPDKKTILAFVNSAFKNKHYWDNNKEKYTESLLQIIKRHYISALDGHLVHIEAATPYTLNRYTRNYKGAAYGWACMTSQFAEPNFRKPTFIEGLYLAGHWTTYVQGLPGVVYSGYDTAKTILRKKQQ
jgi:phytoene dehydrogenase-like protein